MVLTHTKTVVSLLCMQEEYGMYSTDTILAVLL